MYRLLTLMGLGVVATLAVPQEAAAQDCALCSYEDGLHWFPGPICKGQGGCKDCQYAPNGHIGCHGPKAAGYCWTHRSLCPYTNAMSVEPVEGEEILTVVANRDVNGATKLIRGGGVQLNVERRALQMMGCQGAVIGHIPIADDLYADLIASLQLLDDGP